MNKVFLGLGSNIGDRGLYLAKACKELEKILDKFEASPVHNVKPLHVINQPDFLNQIVSGYTNIKPFDFLALIKNIEVALGRKKTFLHGPREIDIDIISYGNMVIEDDSLTIPHPLLYQRLFVLLPLSEIEPDWICPKTGKNVQQLIKELLKTMD